MASVGTIIPASLDVKTPQINTPIQTLGQLAQYRDLASQISMRNAQTQDFQAQANQRLLDQRDQNVLQQAMTDPATNAAIHTGDFSSVAGKVQPSSLFKWQQTQAEAEKTLLANTAEKLQQRRNAISDVSDAVRGLQTTFTRPDGTMDLDGLNGRLTTTIRALTPQLQELGVNMDQLEGYRVSDPKDLNKWVAGLAGGGALVDKALAQKKTEADIASTQAGTRKTTAEAQRQEYINKAIQAQQTAQQTGVHPVDAVFPPPLDRQINASYRNAYDNLMSQPPDENGRHPAAEQLLATAAEHASQIAMANNPLLRQGKANDAAAIESATEPIKVREQVDAEVQKAKLSPDAFAGVFDPVARNRAEAQYQKDSEDYADKAGAARQLQDFVQSVQSGNKAAATMLPMVQVRTLLNRVTRPELQGVSTQAGSAYDRIQGTLSGLKEGQPIPKDLLPDIATVAGVMENAAQNTYHNKVAILRTTYGIDNNKLQPVALPPYQPAGTVLMKAPNGQTRPVPADQVDHYKSKGATVVTQ